MERLSSKILVSSLFVALSVIIIAAVILESRYIQSVDESITVNKPGFATPTPKPIVKVENYNVLQMNIGKLMTKMEDYKYVKNVKQIKKNILF